MTFILGESRLSYDFFGHWTRRLDVAMETPVGVMGDPSNPGSLVPGTFALCGDFRPFRVDMQVVQEQ